MVNSWLARCVFLVSALAGMLAAWMAVRAGCDLPTALLRAALAACACAWLGTLFLGPLSRLLRPEPRPEPEPQAAPAPGAPAPARAKAP
jgi:hypothetical protein